MSDALKLRRCPVCRARLLGDEALDAPCPRCDSDLALVRQALLQARTHQHQARCLLRDGQPGAAARHAFRALVLADTPETRATLCVALALSRL